MSLPRLVRQKKEISKNYPRTCCRKPFKVVNSLKYWMLAFLSKSYYTINSLSLWLTNTFSFVDGNNIIFFLFPSTSILGYISNSMFRSNFSDERCKLLLSNYVDGIKYCDENFMGRKERELLESLLFEVNERKTSSGWGFQSLKLAEKCIL